MARTKGSLNKPKITTGNNLSVLRFEKQIEGSAVTRKNTAYDFISWGAKNNYPDILLGLYNESPTHHAAIQFEVASIVGNGVDYDAMEIDGTQVFPNYAYSYDQLIRNLALDFSIYGTYALQIIKNKDDRTYSFWHMPVDKIRCAPYDDDGQITQYAFSNDWSKISQNPPLWLDAFDMRDDSAIERGKPYIYVYRPYSPTMEYYSSPTYQAAIKAIQSEIEYLNFDLRTTVNNFVPSGMLLLNEVETDEQRREVIDNVQRMFTSSEGANSVMIAFRSNVEESKPEFIPFTASQSNVDLYSNANQRNINRILAGHQIPNASLIGLPDVNGSGFASEADKLETAYQLYQKVTGNYNRSCVIKTINDMFRLNGVDVEIIMKPLVFNDFGGDNDISNDTTTTDAEQDTTTSNIEEQVV